MVRSPRKQCLLENLENRRLMSITPLGGSFVYVETNDPFKGQNSVLAFRENPSTGALTAVPNVQYFTGGTGGNNDAEQLGPDDSDKEVIATPDGNYLFAVNQGSDTIAEFAVQQNGSLKLVTGAPFSSGGTEPVSLSLSNDHLYVVNRGNSAQGTVGTIAPNVVSFTVGEDGYLENGSTVTLPLNLSTAQVLTSANGKFAFVDNFATPSNLKVSLADTLEPFLTGSSGSLTPVAGGQAGLPSSDPPLLLGLVEDPIHHIIYTGLPFPTSGGIATFSYSATTGKVTYDTSLVTTGHATCWLNISPNGKYLYATDSASDAVSVYSLANPLKPVEIQEFYLTGPETGPYDLAATGPTSQDFQFTFDPTGKYIYVVNHTTDSGFQQGNQLQTLDVASNGKVSESAATIFFPRQYVPGAAHIDGIALVTPAGYYGGYASTAVLPPVATPATAFSTTSLISKKLLDKLLDGSPIMNSASI